MLASLTAIDVAVACHGRRGRRGVCRRGGDGTDGISRARTTAVAVVGHEQLLLNLGERVQLCLLCCIVEVYFRPCEGSAVPQSPPCCPSKISLSLLR